MKLIRQIFLEGESPILRYLIKEKVCHYLPCDMDGWRGNNGKSDQQGHRGEGNLIFGIFMVTSFLNGPVMR